jgi:hypothetical protein
MSRVKLNPSDVVVMLNRLKAIKGIDQDKDVAALFGISKNCFCQKKNSGSIFYDIAAYCVLSGINTHWVLQGRRCENFLQ